MPGVVGDIFYFELTGRDRMQHDIKSTIHGLGKLRRENKCNLKQLKKDIKELSNQDTCNNGMFTLFTITVSFTLWTHSPSNVEFSPTFPDRFSSMLLHRRRTKAWDMKRCTWHVQL